MSGLFRRADDVLRQAAWTTRSVHPSAALAWLLTVEIVFGMTYGAAMGMFGGVWGERALQVLYSALKVPMLLLVTFAIGLPSFFVLNTLLGLRRDFLEAFRGVMATQAGLVIVLASLAPFTLFWYASSADYDAALCFNGLMFLVASLAGQWLLRAYYRPLVARNPRHRWMFWIWLGIFVFVGIQMAWILRPFVGNPSDPVQFFREGSWDNAYQVVYEVVYEVVARLLYHAVR